MFVHKKNTKHKKQKKTEYYKHLIHTSNTPSDTCADTHKLYTQSTQTKKKHNKKERDRRERDMVKTKNNVKFTYRENQDYFDLV